MKKKIVSSIIFILLLLVVISPILLSGELLSMEMVVAAQKANKDSVYLFAYSSSDLNAYKKYETIEHKPEILAMGLSAVMQFHGSFFKDKDSFYNAGWGADVSAYEEFLKSMPDGYLPKICIVSIDRMYFNVNFSGAIPVEERTQETQPKLKVSKVNLLKAGQVALSRFYNVASGMTGDYLAGKWNISDLKNAGSHIGIQAISNTEYLLPDGSRYYAKYVDKTVPSDASRVQQNIEMVNSGSSPFNYGDHVNQDMLTILDHFCQYAKKNGIFVVSYSTPFAPSVWRAIDKNAGKYGYMFEFEQKVRPIIEKYGFEYYDYSKLDKLGCDDSYFTDGHHASDSAYCRMMIDMIEKGSVLKDYCDINKLRQMYDKRYSNLVLQDLVN